MQQLTSQQRNKVYALLIIKVEQTFYEPFGDIISGGNESRYSYEGQEYDSLTDDYDFHFRKYDSNLMIFTQPDSVIADVYDPQTLNRYTFERNNPYKYIDKDGKNPAFVIAGIAITYTAIEMAIDVVSLGISAWQFIKDPTSKVNTIALAADVIDITSGPFSNPGPSGLSVRGGAAAWKQVGDKFVSKLTSQGASQVLYNVEKTYFSNSNNLFGVLNSDNYGGFFGTPLGMGLNPLLNTKNTPSSSNKISSDKSNQNLGFSSAYTSENVNTNSKSSNKQSKIGGILRKIFKRK